MCPRSPDLLRSEASFSLSERRSSSDSNKASSGEISPYDNNSPVLCERRGTDGAGCGSAGSSGPERLFRVPEQYALVGQVAGRTREGSSSSSSMWSPTKGEQTGRLAGLAGFLSPTAGANLLWGWVHFNMLSVEQFNCSGSSWSATIWQMHQKWMISDVRSLKTKTVKMMKMLNLRENVIF